MQVAAIRSLHVTARIRQFHSCIVRTLTVLSQSDPFNDFIKAAQSGDLKTVQQLLPCLSSVNKVDSRGWSALMHASFTGSNPVIDALVRAGADTQLTNSTGQTAQELALFQSHLLSAELLSQKSPLSGTDKFSPIHTGDSMGRVQFFGDSPLIRHSDKRTMKAWILTTMQETGTAFIVMHKSKPLVFASETGAGAPVSLRRFTVSDIIDLIEEGPQNVIFLGKVRRNGERAHYTADTALFAVDASSASEKDVLKLDTNCYLMNAYPGALQLHGHDAAVFAHARSMCDWRYRNKFCPACGSDTMVTNSGYKRVCTDPTCMSHSGVFNVSYPRVDPTVITAVVSNDHSQCLLARKASFPPGMFTCVAGFIEPGESMEAACQREVYEEVGVDVGSVEYICSQPWPMPSTLMIGCLSVAKGSSKQQIQLDTDELQDGRWFDRDEVVQMLLRRHPCRLFVPPHQAIAHTLVKTWVLRTAALKQ